MVQYYTHTHSHLHTQTHTYTHRKKQKIDFYTVIGKTFKINYEDYFTGNK